MAKAKIILVEDDLSVSHVIITALRADGYEVESCKSITERDALMASSSYDLLLTDVGLGEGDGISSLDTVKTTHPDIPIIIISAQNTLNTAIDGRGKSSAGRAKSGDAGSLSHDRAPPEK